MVTYQQMHGTVYVLANTLADRVKVGTTINAVSERLRAVNDMWLGRKGTCQICGRRVNLVSGVVPRHAAAGRCCAGTGAPPLESDTAVAAQHLAELRVRRDRVRGVERGSTLRMITTLERRLAMPRHLHHVVGMWQLYATYRTPAAAEVERLTHAILNECLDTAAPFGEVFHCSPEDATAAIERALSQAGVTELAIRARHADRRGAAPSPTPER